MKETVQSIRNAALPTGAIINAQAFADRLEAIYDFECQAGPLRNCFEWIELLRCLNTPRDFANAESSSDLLDKPLSSNPSLVDSALPAMVDKAPEESKPTASTALPTLKGWKLSVEEFPDEITLRIESPTGQVGFFISSRTTVRADVLRDLAKALDNQVAHTPTANTQETAANLDSEDARRYRWLRGAGCNFVWCEIGAGNCLTGLDEAIDAAMAAKDGQP